ncbi:MAG: hypothetical protein Q9M36_09790 [Sulfurovum sp.]|nr:hypothetical protein [Sulfurovum sp.]
MIHILLINTNPVVSNLFTLCIKSTTMRLDEVTFVEGSIDDSYDIVFVDEALGNTKLYKALEKQESIQKICLSYKSKEVKGFDKTIQKPFLPLQVTELLDKVTQKKNALNVLNIEEIETIKYLLDMEIQEEKPSKKSRDKVLKKSVKKALKRMTKQQQNAFFKGKTIALDIKLEE